MIGYNLNPTDFGLVQDYGDKTENAQCWELHV